MQHVSFGTISHVTWHVCPSMCATDMSERIIRWPTETI